MFFYKSKRDFKKVKSIKVSCESKKKEEEGLSIPERELTQGETAVVESDELLKDCFLGMNLK